MAAPRIEIRFKIHPIMFQASPPNTTMLRFAYGKKASLLLPLDLYGYSET